MDPRSEPPFKETSPIRKTLIIILMPITDTISHKSVPPRSPFRAHLAYHYKEISWLSISTCNAKKHHLAFLQVWWQRSRIICWLANFHWTLVMSEISYAAGSLNIYGVICHSRLQELLFSIVPRAGQSCEVSNISSNKKCWHPDGVCGNETY